MSFFSRVCSAVESEVEEIVTDLEAADPTIGIKLAEEVLSGKSAGQIGEDMIQIVVEDLGASCCAHAKK